MKVTFLSVLGELGVSFMGDGGEINRTGDQRVSLKRRPER